MWLKLTILNFIFLGNFGNVTSNINMIEYSKMPPLHRQDEYERCLWSTEELSTYCTVSTLVKPDPSNAIWKQIEQFSNKTKIHFAHDVLFSGHCLSKCEKMLSELSEEEREQLYVETFSHTRKFTYDITAYKNGTLYRKMYDKIFNQCENLWLRKNWNLSGYSTILWCTTNQEFDHYETDYLHTLFLVITFLIVTIVAAATGLDIIQNNEDSLNYYKTERRDLPKSQQCLLCFSLMRNWYRLVAPPKTELGRDLRFVLTIRYLTTLMAVMGHTWIGYSFTPSINPEFIENSYYSFIYIFVNCATNIVQTFFVASGFLLYISINEVFKKGIFNIGYVVVAVLYRYIRLTPTYAYLILYHATYFFRSGSGAYWKFYTETQQSYCRRNWWTNLLYINNYANTGQMCITTSWYLSADTHLFLFSLLLFIFMFKFPKYKKMIMALAFFASCVIQFLVTYLNAFDGGQHFMSPEMKRFLYNNENKEFIKDYMASHMNAGNFIIGIGLGMTYLHLKENKIDMSKYKWFIALWYILPVVGFFTVCVHGYIFFHNYFEVPSFGLTLLSMFTRQIWGIFGIILVLGFIASFRSPIKNFFNWPVFTSLSRLTYGVYLVHITIASLMFAQSAQNIYLMGWMFLTESLALFVLSNFAALVLGLFIEFPLTALSKTLLRPNRKVKKHIEEDCNGNTAELTRFSSNH